LPKEPHAGITQVKSWKYLWRRHAIYFDSSEKC